MKVHELISKIVDNYLDITVSEIHGVELTGRGWTIRPHAMEYENIPEDIWEKEVDTIALYHNGLSVLVKT